jgi:collagenase-like PrtC family protease
MLTEKLKAHLKRLHQYNRKPDAGINRVWRNYRLSAKQRKIEFTLDRNEFDRLVVGCMFLLRPATEQRNDWRRVSVFCTVV